MKARGFRFDVASVLCCALLAGCGPAPSANNQFQHAVQVTDAGKPTCLKTTAIQNDLAAQATNAIRQRARLPLVTPSPLLADIAARHACDMARRGLMTHEGTGSPGPGARVKARGYRPTLTAENIAAGPYNLGTVLVAWNTAPRHLANVLIPQVRDYGIGQAISADGKTHFWAAIYAAPAPGP